MSAEIVNLNRYRKEKSRQEKARLAEESRALHGRTKAERQLTTAETTQARKRLDRLQREVTPGGDGDEAEAETLTPDAKDPRR